MDRTFTENKIFLLKFCSLHSESERWKAVCFIGDEIWHRYKIHDLLIWVENEWNIFVLYSPSHLGAVMSHKQNKTSTEVFKPLTVTTTRRYHQTIQINQHIQKVPGFCPHDKHVDLKKKESTRHKIVCCNS